MSVRETLPVRAARFLKAELKRADVTYAELARRMTDAGIVETEASVKSKVNRGEFPLWWAAAALRLVGGTSIRLEDV